MRRCYPRQGRNGSLSPFTFCLLNQTTGNGLCFLFPGTFHCHLSLVDMQDLNTFVYLFGLMIDMTEALVEVNKTTCDSCLGNQTLIPHVDQ